MVRLVAALEGAEIPWCAIGGVAVNHWAAEPMVTRDVGFVVATEEIGRACQVLSAAGFTAEKHEWSINFTGRSAVSMQLSTEDFYRDFPSRSVPADVHGILMRVAALEDALAGKVKAWSDPERRQSKRINDLADIARLVEAHPRLWERLPEKLRKQIEKPG